MVDHDALVDAFQDYSQVLLGPYEIGDVLYQLTDQAVEVLGVDGAGVSVAQDGDDRLTFVAATDASVATVEATQERGGEGPCHDAYRHGKQVTVTDLTMETRWPVYVQVATDEGCLSVAGLPMPLGGRRIGALNLYRRTRHDWHDDELQVGQVLANMATGYILNHTELSDTRTVVDQLQRALDSRVIIEQAKGVVAASRRMNPDEAFDLLRNHARCTQTQLHDLCRHVVEATVKLP